MQSSNIRAEFVDYYMVFAKLLAPETGITFPNRDRAMILFSRLIAINQLRLITVLLKRHLQEELESQHLLV